MMEWRWTESESKAKLIDYVVVEGRPGKIEDEVKEHIKQGYRLNGPMYEYIVPGSNNKIFIQSLVKYQETTS